MAEPATGVSGLVVEPGRDLYLVLLALEKGRSLTQPLAGIIECTGKTGIELLDVWTTHGEFMTTTLLAISSPSLDEVKALTQCLSSSTGALAVNYLASRRKGIIVESWGFPVLPYTRRVLLVELDMLSNVLREGWRLLGRSLGVAIYHASFLYGQDLVKKLRGLGLEGEDVLIVSSEILRHLGMGHVVWEEVGGSKAVAAVHDSIECRGAAGIPGYESSLMRGVVAGILAGFWGVDKGRVEAREVNCIARGDKECRFEVTLKPR
ncbi:MAG: hypothetical protein ABWK01_03315 [Infirmifilum sp.]